MFNTKYIDINQIIEKIKRGGLYKEMPFDTAVAYAVECYRLLNSEKAEVSKPYFNKVENYRSILPEDFERVIATAKTDAAFSCIQKMAYSTSDLSSVRHCVGSPDLHCSSPYTYSLNSNYIITSFDTGYIFMVYTGLKTNEQGLIMIPDQVDVIKAVSSYIKYEYLKDMASDDPVVNKHMDIESQEYCWYIGKAQASMTDLSYDEYRSLANSMNKFLDNEDHFDSFMTDMGVKQYLVNQRYG